MAIPIVNFSTKWTNLWKALTNTKTTAPTDIVVRDNGVPTAMTPAALASVLGVGEGSVGKSYNPGTVQSMDDINSFRGALRVRVSGAGPDGQTNSYYHVLCVGQDNAQVSQFWWRSTGSAPVIYCRILDCSNGIYTNSAGKFWTLSFN